MPSIDGLNVPAFCLWLISYYPTTTDQVNSLSTQSTLHSETSHPHPERLPVLKLADGFVHKLYVTFNKMGQNIY